MDEETKTNIPHFGTTHTINPTATHTHTILMLHGRGSTGPDFAQEFLLYTYSSDYVPLNQKLSPGIRWVFPSSQEHWSPIFQQWLPEWFEVPSLTDIELKKGLQISGIRQSVRYLQMMIKDEIEKLGGDARKLIIGGISQGAAIGFWTLLCGGCTADIGGFFGSSTWLPFASNLARLLDSSRSINTTEDAAAVDKNEEDEVDSFVASMLPQDSAQESGSVTKQQQQQQQHSEKRAFKLFLGHGIDDGKVNVALGRQARDVVRSAGFEVEWKEYSGAEAEGHWFKEPEQMDDIYEFIRDIVSKQERATETE